MPPEQDMQIINFSQLELPRRVGTKKADRERRRLMTLLVEVDAQDAMEGGVGYVVKARNLMGETFALKRLRAKDALGAKSANTTQLEASLRQEYETHCQVQHTGRVPALYGYARSKDGPAILMEWIDGITLRNAAAALTDAQGRLPLQTLVDIGIACLEALVDIQNVGANLVHRDISPANIMLRTASADLEEQCTSGNFDVVLIDFGSMTAGEKPHDSFTVVENLWRGATPDYAPPEMLGHDDPALVELRRSPKIDVYALCSVLYRLYSGHAPFRLSRQEEAPTYHVKMTAAPLPLDVRGGDDGSLADVVMSGLAVEQAERPSAVELLRALLEWEKRVGAGGRHAAVAVRYFPPGGSAGAGSESLASASNTPRSMSAGTQFIMNPDAEDVSSDTKIAELDDRNGHRNISRRALVTGGLAAVACLVGGFALASYVRHGNSVAGVAEFVPGMHLMRVKHDGKWGFVNVERKWVVEPAYKNAMSNFSYETPQGKHGLPLAFAQADDGLIGFVTPADSPDAPTIPYRYKGAGMFFGGFAPVIDAQEELWGFIDSNGNYVVEPQFADALAVSALKDTDASDGADDECYVAGVCTGQGEWNYVRFPGSSEMPYCVPLLREPVAQVGVAGDGMLPVAYGDSVHCGFMAQDGVLYGDAKAWAIEPVHHDVRSFTEGLAAFSDDGETWGYLNKDGSVAVQPAFAEVREFTSLGLAAAKDVRTGLWGFIDTKGQWASANTSPRFAELGNLEIGDDGASRRGVAAAKEQSSGLWGFVAEDGTWIIDPAFEDAGIKASAGEVRTVA